MKISHIYLSILLLSFSSVSFAQVDSTGATADTTKKVVEHVIIKNDGTEYIGVILKDDGREVLIETRSIGKVYITKSAIKSMIKLEDANSVVYGEYRATGPFTTRYAFTNNALPIVKGENYTMVNLFGPEVHFAVTNNLNIGIMSTWIASPFVLALKYSFKKEESKVNFSLGTLAGTSGYLNSFNDYGGLHWLSMTLGDRLNNITFSAGYGYIGSDISNYSIMEEGVYANYENPTYKNIPLNYGPLFSMAGIVKVGAKASFFFDSMCLLYEKEASTQVYNGAGTITVTNSKSLRTVLLIMPGMRFQTTEDKAFQFSLAGVSVFGGNTGNRNFPLPMVSWFKKF